MTSYRYDITRQKDTLSEEQLLIDIHIETCIKLTQNRIIRRLRCEITIDIHVFTSAIELLWSRSTSGQVLADYRPFMTYCRGGAEASVLRFPGSSPAMEMAAVRIQHQTIGVCLLAPMCGGKTPRLQWYSSSCIYGDNVHQCSHIHTLHEGNVSMETRESGLTPGWLL